MSPRRGRRPAAFFFLGGLFALGAGCGGKRFRALEAEHKQIQKQLDEMKTLLVGMDKRLALKDALGSAPGGTSQTAGLTVATLLADTLAYSGRDVQVEAVMASPVDKERGFFVVTNKPKDVMSNVGVYYDPEDISTKRDVYLSDPGQWLSIDGQLTVDHAPNGFKTYSGYALKARSVRKINK